MKKLKIDCGVESYQLGNFGVVRFNPADPSLFQRFLTGDARVKALDQEVQRELQEAGGDPGAILAILDRADKRVKDLLGWIFGKDNDFREIFKEVNLLTPDYDGEPILTQLMAALTEPVKAGLTRWTEGQVAQAREKAAHRRQSQ